MIQKITGLSAAAGLMAQENKNEVYAAELQNIAVPGRLSVIRPAAVTGLAKDRPFHFASQFLRQRRNSHLTDFGSAGELEPRAS